MKHFLSSSALLALCLLTALTASAAEPLRVGMELSYPPFEMTDPQGKPTGVSVRLAEALGRHLGRDVMIDAPSPISEEQLRELVIEVRRD